MAARAFVQGYECHAFSERERYRPLMLWLLDHCDVGPDSSIVDIGCGSGSLIEEALARFPDAPGLRIIGVDPSGPELDIARSRIADPRVTLIQGLARQVLQRDGGADVVILSNVLHLISRHERMDLFRAVRQLLRDGGRFGFNTPFYDGAVIPQTRWFYMRWMVKARARLAAMGVAPASPDPAAPARETLSPAEHERLLCTAGFSSASGEELLFEWTEEDWGALCGYSLFIRGALGEVDLAAGQAALTQAMRETFADLRLTSVPRRWLHMVAVN